MRRLGMYLDATPLVIGLRTRDEELEPGVVYFRHGVPVLSPDTATDLFVEEVPPLIYAAPGGLYVSIDGNILADAREDREWSLGQLANELGVSRRTVSKYEDGMNASVEIAVQLEEMFDAPLTNPVDVFDPDEVHEDESTPEDPEVGPDDERLVAVLTRVGFDVHPTLRSPFNAVSEDEREETKMLTGHSAFNRTAEKRARIMSSVGHVTRTTSIYVVDETKRESVDGTALIRREEIEEIDDSDSLKDLVRERADEMMES